MSGLYTDAGTCNIVRQHRRECHVCHVLGGAKTATVNHLSIFICMSVTARGLEGQGGRGREREEKAGEGRETRGYESLTDGAAEADVPILLCAWLCWQWQQHLDHLMCPNLGVSATFTQDKLNTHL